ncbi:MAG: hypothetical protein AAF368_14445, partial [Planctomycetota bacterium]
MEWKPQLLGAQISVWEQEESSLVRDLHRRVPILADRLWSKEHTPTEILLRRMQAVDERILPIVQPIEILPQSSNRGPLELLFRSYEDNQVQVRLRNRTKLRGSIEVASLPFEGSLTWISF